MIKHLLTILLTLNAVSCSPGTSSDKLDPDKIPPFPYEDILSDSDSTDYFPVIGLDGNGFAPIAHHVEYLTGEHRGDNQLYADSLQEAYNFTLAFNSFAYDTGTYARYLDSNHIDPKAFAQAMDSMSMPDISDAQLLHCLDRIRMEVASLMRQGKEAAPDDELLRDLNMRYYEIWGPLASGEPEKPKPETILPNYADIHRIAMTDTLNGRDRLLAMTINETDFLKKTFLAREFAYANYINDEPDDKLLIAVLDPLLKAGQYSPVLDELWLMWRATLQLHLFSSGSNDSAMYNLFYNAVRNQVARTLLDYVQAHRDDNVARTTFFSLMYQYCICRNSNCLFGNNANLDVMSLYYECWNQEKMPESKEEATE